MSGLTSAQAGAQAKGETGGPNSGERNSADRGSLLPGGLEAVSYAAGGRLLITELDLIFTAGPRSFVLGPNGAGKSLLLRLAHGLIAPSSGRVVWQGGRQNGRPNGHRGNQGRQAMVFQRPVLLRRSAAANVDYALALHGIKGAEQARRRDEALEATGLADLAKRPARVLSAGEQQRLALARAWAIRPGILFLDEPTASLDPAATRAVEAIVGAIHDAGTKIIMTSHDLGQARRLADEVIFLHRGRLLERTAAAQFFSEPTSREARAYLQGDLLW